MVLISFTHRDVERKALGFLARRFSIQTWASGKTLVPEAALDAMTAEGIAFVREGRATYEQRIPKVRDPASSSIQ